MAQANIKAVITAEDKASSTLKSFGNAVENVNDKVITGAKRAAFALAAAATAATAFSVKSAADFEQTRIGLENMLGSADKARVLLQQISKFAAETPFEFPELAQATRQLVAFGFSAEEAFDTMKQLGNVSAAVGAPINDLAYLMGTLRAQGRAFTIDIRQFAMRGIPIYEYLAKVLKVNTQQLTELIEEGKVGFPEVQKAFQLLAGAGGKWGDTMARQSKSLTGLFSTLKDVLGQTGRELIGITQEGDIKAGSAFDLLRQAVGSLIANLPTLISQMKEIVKDILPQLRQWASNIADVATQIGNYLAPKLEALWNTLSQRLIPALKQFWIEILEPLVPVIGVALVGALGGAIDLFNILLVAVSAVITFLTDHQWVFWAIVSVLGAIKVALMLNGALAAFQGVIAGVTSTYGGLQLLIATPLVMPAIIVGAAIAAIISVKQAADETKRAIDGMNDASEMLAETRISTHKRLLELSRSGDAGQRERANKLLAEGMATGGPVSGGTPYFVGEKGPELFVPNQSGTIVPNNKMSGTTNLVVNVGMYAGTEMEKRKIAESLMRAFNDLQASRGLA